MPGDQSYASRTERVHSVDLMRGLVMILMALDHVRDLLHVTSVTQSPTDLSTASPALFLTRWITHLCAPTFVFLSGVSAFLAHRRSYPAPAASRHLLYRGISLIILDFTVVNFGVWFDVHFDVFLFDVLSAIGCGLMVLWLLRNQSGKLIAATGLSILLLSFYMMQLPPGAGLPLAGRIGLALFRTDAFPLYAVKILIIGYPPLPWVGILLTGFAAGPLFLLPEARRRRLFLKTGLAAISVFLVLRWINLYGDNLSWSTQKSGLYTFLSFLNVTKYPPSPDFCLLFPGIMFLILSAVQGLKNRYTAIVCTYGKVPLFYFLVHWYFIHPLVLLTVWLQRFKSSELVFGTNFGRPKAPSGLPLWAVYLTWLGVVVLLFPLCRWYGTYKAANKEKAWLRFL